MSCELNSLDWKTTTFYHLRTASSKTLYLSSMNKTLFLEHLQHKEEKNKNIFLQEVVTIMDCLSRDILIQLSVLSVIAELCIRR